mmetsp:Transcript_63944/g.133290  ORF Transcript_63944/g.133290 Transcript_63944/m.133290 type:complete len:430 (+) Transcript_63944:145-1434(+)
MPESLVALVSDSVKHFIASVIGVKHGEGGGRRRRRRQGGAGGEALVPLKKDLLTVVNHFIILRINQCLALLAKQSPNREIVLPCRRCCPRRHSSSSSSTSFSGREQGSVDASKLAELPLPFVSVAPSPAAALSSLCCLRQELTDHSRRRIHLLLLLRSDAHHSIMLPMHRLQTTFFRSPPRFEPHTRARVLLHFPQRSPPRPDNQPHVISAHGNLGLLAPGRINLGCSALGWIEHGCIQLVRCRISCSNCHETRLARHELMFQCQRPRHTFRDALPGLSPVWRDKEAAIQAAACANSVLVLLDGSSSSEAVSGIALNNVLVRNRDRDSERPIRSLRLHVHALRELLRRFALRKKGPGHEELPVEHWRQISRKHQGARRRIDSNRWLICVWTAVREETSLDSTEHRSCGGSRAGDWASGYARAGRVCDRT